MNQKEFNDFIGKVINGEVEIVEYKSKSDVTYTLSYISHRNALKVFKYLMEVYEPLISGKMSFIGSDEWNKIEELLNSHILVDSCQISKIPEFWQENRKDYIRVMLLFICAVSSPFFQDML